MLSIHTCVCMCSLKLPSEAVYYTVMAYKPYFITPYFHPTLHTHPTLAHSHTHTLIHPLPISHTISPPSPLLPSPPSLPLPPCSTYTCTPGPRGPWADGGLLGVGGFCSGRGDWKCCHWALPHWPAAGSASSAASRRDCNVFNYYTDMCASVEFLFSFIVVEKNHNFSTFCCCWRKVVLFTFCCCWEEFQFLSLQLSKIFRARSIITQW